MANNHELAICECNELLANELWAIMSSWSPLNYLKHDNGLLQESESFKLLKTRQWFTARGLTISTCLTSQ